MVDPINQSNTVRLLDPTSSQLARMRTQQKHILRTRVANRTNMTQQKQQCHKCGFIGHIRANCPTKGSKGTKWTRMDVCYNGCKGKHSYKCCMDRGRCFTCGEKGHIQAQCLYNNMCLICGFTGHLKKDCPQVVLEEDAEGHIGGTPNRMAA